MNERELEREQDNRQGQETNAEQAQTETAAPDSTQAGGGCCDQPDTWRPEAESTGDSSAEDESTAAEPGPGTVDLDTLRQQWEQERTDLVNRLLRLKADFDNYKRRTEAQIETIRATANQNLLTGLLPVIDNFQRAIAAADEDSPYLAGVKMIFEQLMDCLYKEGLTPIEAVGKPFDPTIHEAVSMEGGAGGDLIVSEELQKGYFYKNKLLRASMVKVAPKQHHEEE